MADFENISAGFLWLNVKRVQGFEGARVDSHNPLKLLHNALSVGVHAESDENCLKLAKSIRLVLADLSERLKLALGEQDELRFAVSGLLKFVSEAKKKEKI